MAVKDNGRPGKSNDLKVSMLLERSGKTSGRVFIVFQGRSRTKKLIIEKGKGQADVMEFEKIKDAKEYVNQEILKTNKPGKRTHWSHKYPIFIQWLRDQFNVTV